jgi:hypothetical protein
VTQVSVYLGTAMGKFNRAANWMISLQELKIRYQFHIFFIPHCLQTGVNNHSHPIHEDTHVNNVTVSCEMNLVLWCDVLMMTNIEKDFSGYQLCYFIKNHQRFRDHLCSCYQGTDDLDAHLHLCPDVGDGNGP